MSSSSDDSYTSSEQEDVTETSGATEDEETAEACTDGSISPLHPDPTRFHGLNQAVADMMAFLEAEDLGDLLTIEKFVDFINDNTSGDAAIESEPDEGRMDELISFYVTV